MAELMINNLWCVFYLFLYGIPSGPRGQQSGEDAVYGASSVHHVQLNNKSSFDVYTSHTIFNIIHIGGISNNIR